MQTPRINVYGIIVETCFGAKIVVCHPGSTEVAKASGKNVEISKYIKRIVIIPDMNFNNIFCGIFIL